MSGKYGPFPAPGSAGAQSYPVDVVAFDQWVKAHSAGRVSVCKIDAEGAKLHFLQGMSELLDRVGPALEVDVIDEHLIQFGGSDSDLLSFLSGLGYTDVTPRYNCHGDCNRYLVKARLCSN